MVARTIRAMKDNQSPGVDMGFLPNYFWKL